MPANVGWKEWPVGLKSFIFLRYMQVFDAAREFFLRIFSSLSFDLFLLSNSPKGFPPSVGVVVEVR